MGQPLHRTQILLEPRQHHELTRIAAEEHRSLSDLLREIVQKELDRLRCDAERARVERVAAIERIRQNRRRAAALGEVDPTLDSVELLREAREERAEELWPVGGRADD
ncbi:MAG TPA: hypothetical protein VHM02_15005 [Thermoanaerobaculia bacterium]|nr:hypothetical protein [Thermoanaerobaculia bacterium]